MCNAIAPVNNAKNQNEGGTGKRLLPTTPEKAFLLVSPTGQLQSKDVQSVGASG
jgi:hypothetical protein